MPEDMAGCNAWGDTENVVRDEAPLNTYRTIYRICSVTDKSPKLLLPFLTQLH